MPGVPAKPRRELDTAVDTAAHSRAGGHNQAAVRSRLAVCSWAAIHRPLAVVHTPAVADHNRVAARTRRVGDHSRAVAGSHPRL
jgi:hypothetical protein